MTPKEFTAWKRFQMTNACYWRIDVIHDGVNGREFLAYVADPTFPTRGLFVSIEPDGTLNMGTYKDFDVTIGDAEFHNKISRKFENMNFAFSQACEKYKLTFLKELRRGKPPFRSQVGKFL